MACCPHKGQRGEYFAGPWQSSARLSACALTANIKAKACEWNHCHCGIPSEKCDCELKDISDIRAPHNVQYGVGAVRAHTI
eukprot:scaffold7923_cov121-Isochrysis_galbana.AAC.5